MGIEDNSVAGNVFAWLLNVSSSVMIVFVNKILIDQRGEYAFAFACTLSAIHFLTAAACMKTAQLFKSKQEQQSPATLPWKDTLYFATVAVVSIASLNLSLLVNPVGLYQVAKLLIIPFVCAVEAVWLGHRFTKATICCIITVVVGVAVVTVHDLGAGSTGMLGVALAAVSVVSSGMQQILCSTMQRTHRLQSSQLLAATAPVQGSILVVMGPWIDAAVSGNWIGSYTMSSGAAGVLCMSCAISVAVNLSQFMCLGRFSTVTFQVLGHTKTILVLLISWLVLGEAMSRRKLTGMALAVAGMIAYSYFVNLSSCNSTASSSIAADTKQVAADSSGQGILESMELGQSKQQQLQQRDEEAAPLLVSK